MVNKFIRASVLSLFMMLATGAYFATVQQAYATATLMPPPFSKFFYPSGSALAGQPLAGGEVFTYTAGTTTPLASYTDSTALVQNPNPVILDSNGQASIWIAGAYKIVVEDPNGVVLSTTDNVQDLFTYNLIQSTSTTSLAVQNGSPITLTTQAGKYFSPGLFVMITDNAAPTANWMHCPITSYVGTQLICTPDASAGSGTKTAWTISLSGPLGPTGATGATGSGAGDMVGANNLAVGAGGVTSAATARSNLGLGSSAIVNAGTGASQMVQLTAASKLPAVDGSLLTNVAGVPAVTNSSNGKIVMGAVTVEWGATTLSANPSVTFPTAFSGVPYSVTLTTQEAGPSTYSVMLKAAPTASGFSTYTFSTGSGNNVNEIVNWVAFGPT